ncbi:TFIIB-type zinc ribbon-containing protein [Propionicimonas sp.]|uniref:TFIIB-type zinc ribbon-containing protein n=1 Tax=Propionicimonas sp. TaxID=1955623 RepID=UPI001793A86B|nr:TFIIB-type zinc ribbon-containing protein [Propionicimonas sp.]MBU3976505.1 TFIIB-type zinc ribbon-containing protein [Actinomycetota bacterium]MBA3020345.1 TFIIB-type zinc ribbon-containing protein [Propionicimonas sp.]MBU3987337.1 TFIIB-type zinc ribbon-containing protein [Actinomycetota bacterium]MBU4007649.1 TFIIB-type zinc ribbon-containing protein [Actinomycetota bacterium]MBU4064430.1 TFIIB-type zinc ribbon-containing protein [Actinomycetota bacterium]
MSNSAPEPIPQPVAAEGGGTAPPPPLPTQQIGEPTSGSATAEPQRVDTANTRLTDGLNRCPKCGSTDIQLRVSTGMLVCLFCRHEWSEAQVEPMVSGDVSLRDLTGTTIASGASDISPEVSGMMTLKCSGCGSEVVVNTAEAMSSRCHWCRHVLTINEQIPNGAVPDAVLPFSITQAQAVEKIREFAGKRRIFAHKSFRAGFSPENVMGVYLPYMVVDGNASADVQGFGEIETRRYTRKVGDHDETYYDADVYQLNRHVDYTVDDLTIESSAERANINAMVNTNNIINTIMPFDTKNAVQWNANYLVGYTSERRDQDVSQIQPVLEDQLLSIARSQVHNSVRQYNRGVRWEAEHLDVHGTRWVAMYLPVWLYSFYQEGKSSSMVHYIAVNGRTGETMGSVPVSHGRLILAALAAGTVLEAIVIWILVMMS